MSILAIILIVLLLVALFGGYYGSVTPRYTDTYGPLLHWSPTVIILVILLILFFTNRL